MNAALSVICSCTWHGLVRTQGIDCPVHDPVEMRRRQLTRDRITATQGLKELEFEYAYLLPARIASMCRRVETLNKQLRELGE